MGNTSSSGLLRGTWSGGSSFCNAHHTGFFCNSDTRIRCCKDWHGWYVQCGTTVHSTSCGWRGGSSAGWHIHPGWHVSSYCESHHVGTFCSNHRRIHCCNDYGHYVESTRDTTTTTGAKTLRLQAYYILQLTARLLLYHRLPRYELRELFEFRKDESRVCTAYRTMCRLECGTHVDQPTEQVVSMILVK